MQESMTPSRVLDEYDIIGRDISATRISEIRQEFFISEQNRVNIWKLLSDQVKTEIELENLKQKERTIEEERRWIAQACAEVLLSKNEKGDENDGLIWRERIAELCTPTDYFSFFEVLGISASLCDEEKVGTAYHSITNPSLNKFYKKAPWKSTTWLRRNGFNSLKVEIVNKFKTWENFMTFLGFEYDWERVISNCKDPSDFLHIFSALGVSEDRWQIRNALQSDGFNFIYTYILNDQRFNEWKDFLQFMGIEVTETYASMLRNCKNDEDVRKMFENLKIDYEIWTNANLLGVACPGIAGAIPRDPRFPKFDDFLLFAKASRTWQQRIALCSSREDFEQIFAEEKVSKINWSSCGWLIDNGYGGLYKALYNRFESWENFLNFMGILKPFQIVQKCLLPIDFIELFKNLGVKFVQGSTAEFLKKDRNHGIYFAIVKDPRFGCWENFINWMKEYDESEIIDSLKLQDAIALLGHDPAKLKLYLKISHPELSEDEIDRLVTRSFRGLTIKKEFDYSEFEESLEQCTIISEVPSDTENPTITIEGHAPGADSVMIFSKWNRRVRVAGDGYFKAKIVLDIGKLNNIEFMSLNHDKKQRSESASFTVDQTAEQDDLAALVQLIEGMGRAALSEIQKNLGRFNHLVRATEQVLIKKFSKSFEEGRNFVEMLSSQSRAPVVRKVLKKVLDNFRKIDRTKYPNVKRDSPLYFFQKYCVAEIQRKIENGEPGVILANAPGLGKTRTALVAVNGDPATIIAPNSVVSAWGEEADKSLVNADVLTLQNIPHKERIHLLEESDASHVVTNIEFLRSANEQDPRYQLLANDSTIVIHDEAHALSNLGTEQSKGARRLNSKFHLYLTATPFKDPSMMRRMFYNLYPDDKRFSSDKAFSEAFPSNDPQSLRTLSVLKEKHVIRFRKEDVLDDMDPNQPIQDQIHRLPRKEYLQPEQFGEFTMSEEQADAIYELFLDWPSWTNKYDKYVPKDEIAKMDNLRGNQFMMAKLHALRQTVNNPEYIGAKDVEDPKSKEVMRAVQQFLREGRKIVIFCQYNAQAEKYAELLSKYKPALYTGITSAQGLMKDKNGNEIRYKKHENSGWHLDERGYPIEDKNGMPMLAMDYERLTFQNAEDRKVILATYSAGAVGVTFTAGKAVIEDDLPRDCVEEIQAEDRTHRIDHDHQTHHSIKYVKLVSKYPTAFLDRMKKVWVEKTESGSYKEIYNRKYAERNSLKTAYDTFFAQGTFDEVKLENLAVQRKMFQLINDGIADESVLAEGQMKLPV